MSTTNIKSKTSRGISEALMKWISPFSYEKAKYLSAVGHEEMIHLGQRFRDRLKYIDKKLNFSRHIVTFSTSLTRSKSSRTTFLQQFTSKARSFEEVALMIKENDYHLRFFDNCPYYTSSVLKNKSSNPEYKMFLNSPIIEQVLKEINNKWNLADANLTADDARVMYMMCGYEIANNVSVYMIKTGTNSIRPMEAWTVPVISMPLNKGLHFATFWSLIISTYLSTCTTSNITGPSHMGIVSIGSLVVT